jgi:hypothetical protein
VRLPVLGRDDGTGGVTGGGAVPVATASQIVAALSRAAPVRSQLNLVIELDLAARVVAEGRARAALYRRMRAGPDATGINWAGLLTNEMGEPLADDSGQFIDAQLPEGVPDAGVTSANHRRGRAAMIDPVGGGTRAVTIAAAGLSQTDFVAAPTLEALPGEFKRVPTVSGQTVAPDTVHLTLRDDSAETYALRGFGLYLSDGTLFAVHSEPDPILEKAAFATLLLAFDWTLAASDAAAITFGDTSFLNPRPPRRSPGWSNWPALPKRWPVVADKAITPATMGQTLAGYVRGAQLGAAGGVATLGEDGKLALAQRPPIDLIDVWPVASEAQMLALADATAGDFAVRSDNGLVYVLQHPPASELANWLEISTPAPVSSVNGKVGAVALGAGDVGAARRGGRSARKARCWAAAAR